MKRMYIALLAMTFLPSVAFAARLQEYMIYAVDFFEDYLLPLLIAIAVLIFFINLVRYFLLAGGSEDGRTKARSLAFWGIIAFFLILSLWGVVRLVTYTFGISGNNVVCPEYVNCNPSSGARSGGGSLFNVNVDLDRVFRGGDTNDQQQPQDQSHTGTSGFWEGTY